MMSSLYRLIYEKRKKLRKLFLSMKALNKVFGVFVVGNPVCFAKSIVGGPVFRFSADFSKYPEWALERQRSKNGETKLLGFSSLEILYVLPNLLLLGQFSDFPLIVPWVGPGAPNKQNCRNKMFGVFVVGNRVCFAKSIVGGPVFRFSAFFLSTLSEPWSAKGAKLTKQNCWGFRRWKSCMFCQIYCCWASFRISRIFL